MPKPVRSSNCLLLEGKIQDVIAKLDNISLQDLRQGGSIMPIVSAIIQLQDLKDHLHESV